MTVSITKGLDSASKLKLLGQRARYDVCGYPSLLGQPKLRPAHFIYPAAGEGGRCVRLFKVLQTNACQGNCLYCANRKDRTFPRISFRPQELARLFMEYYKRGLVDGIFLSSAIAKSPDESQQDLLRTLKLIRYNFGYEGYIHCKILPGASFELIKEASKVADRLSINLEAPGKNYLARLSPTKDFHNQLLKGIGQIAQINVSNPLKAGLTTQLVVGAGQESDREILDMTYELYRKFNLWRVYYSGFTPLKETPLEDHPPCSPWREVRLYQADFLIRKYRFKTAELPLDAKGNLPEDIDPKLAWARAHPERFPIEINRASYWDLIKVPGIGRISARRIVWVRKVSKIRDVVALKKLGAQVKRAQNYITLDGKSYFKKALTSQRDLDRQLFLWEEI